MKTIYLKTKKTHAEFVELITQARTLGIFFKKRYGYTQCNIRSGIKPELPDVLQIKFMLTKHINDIKVIHEQV